MAIVFATAAGATSGAATVTVLVGPGAGQRVVRGFVFHNRDTAPVTMLLSFFDGVNERRMFRVTVPVDDSFIHSDPIVLGTAAKVLRIALTGAVATTEPEWVANYAEYTP